ncbi:MAG: hypothetical protein AVDCRST_MAG71-1898 [uncultured Lysobacter sp.]|uniref:Uncharacterized protein n=1 Tax=uncultured Lysobacter sp. TaxID=271060 RepID=A0A6J4LLW4_9GAMM|nr:MAG: hypothetical protein AVDCRST_MAG71-1898 [uncultured Lysobacter sp.]
MTTDKNDNPPARTGTPNRQKAQPQAHERLDAQGYKDAEELNPRNDLGQGSERAQGQGRGNDPDRG